MKPDVLSYNSIERPECLLPCNFRPFILTTKLLNDKWVNLLKPEIIFANTFHPPMLRIFCILTLFESVDKYCWLKIEAKSIDDTRSSKMDANQISLDLFIL
ncbi:hypothetical protein BLOT_014667 [Blomia tropicalis]|nr:hypothetical protein BLOT_014667 [Blomia tropicalis]